MHLSNKRGVELTLQTIVIMIILLIVLLFVIYFFVTTYGDGSKSAIDLGNGAIDIAKSAE